MAEPGSFLERVFPDNTPLDPNQFLVPWDTTFEMLAFVVVLSIIVERVLAVLFESKSFIEFKRNRRKANKSANQEIIAFLFSLLLCWLYQVDIVAVMMSHEHISAFGVLITAGVVSGGSKGSIKLFREVLGFKSGAYQEYENTKDPKDDAPKPPDNTEGKDKN
jgi:hypothetical protein